MDIDTHTDVCALGVMLYELLTGSSPLDSKQLQCGAVLEMLRLVREVEPPKPSTKLSTANDLPNIAANRGVEPAKLATSPRGEVGAGEGPDAALRDGQRPGPGHSALSGR